eukprot:Rhum_TRINITY_DN8743_c0_g1::Rhum_TRINITY_DN8743_c0_g1_i1::g.29691::m.29691
MDSLTERIASLGLGDLLDGDNAFSVASVESATDAFWQQPLFFASVMTPLLVRFLCAFKRAPAPRSAAAHKGSAAADGGGSSGRSTPAKIASRVFQLLWTILVLFFVACVGAVVYVVTMWNGAVVTLPCIALLFVTARSTKRPAFVYDLCVSVGVCFLLSALTVVNTDTMLTHVVVSQDPAHAKAYRTIQEGIDAVREGGSVRVIPGHYRERLVVNKNIYLLGMGASPSDTVVSLPPGAADSAVLMFASDSVATNIRIEGGAAGAAAGGGGGGGGDGCTPLVYFGDSFLGSALTDVEVAGCSGACLYSVAGHPFLAHRLRRVTLLAGGAAGEKKEFDDVLLQTKDEVVGMKPGQVCPLKVAGAEGSSAAVAAAEAAAGGKGGPQAGGGALPAKTEVARVVDAVAKTTRPHVKTLVLLLRWLDASAHWTIVVYRWTVKHVLPVAVQWGHFAGTHTAAGGRAFMRGFRSFLCGAVDYVPICPADRHEWMFVVGSWVHSMVGDSFTYAFVFLIDAGQFFLSHVVTPILSYAAAYLPMMAFGFLSGYFATSQYLQVGIHLLSGLGTASYVFSGDLLSLFSNGPFNTVLLLGKNSTVLIPLGIEYLGSVFVIASAWIIVPLILPFINVYVTMILIHVALPLQSIYSFVKRHNKGAWVKRYDYWALMFLGRVVVQLQPTIVFCLVAGVVLFLRHLNGATPDVSADKVAEADSARALEKAKEAEAKREVTRKLEEQQEKEDAAKKAAADEKEAEKKKKKKNEEAKKTPAAASPEKEKKKAAAAPEADSPTEAKKDEKDEKEKEKDTEKEKEKMQEKVSA